MNHPENGNTLGFRDLLIGMEEALGTSEMLVNRSASEPADLLYPTGVHDRLLRRIFKQIYKTNRCYHIRARISYETTLSALTHFREELLANPGTDISVITLLDNLELALKIFFRQSAPATTKENRVRASRTRHLAPTLAAAPATGDRFTPNRNPGA